MARLSEELRSFLMDVSISGGEIIEKRKLLWLLGRGQDRPSAWDEVLDHWEDIGLDRSALHGAEVGGGNILLVAGDAKLVPVTEWAN